MKGSTMTSTQELLLIYFSKLNDLTSAHKVVALITRELEELEQQIREESGTNISSLREHYENVQERDS